MTIERFLTLILVVPLLFCCKPQVPDVGTGPDIGPTDNPVDPDHQEATEDYYKNAAPELKSGSTVLATNRNVQKFLEEVTYPDKDWSYTKVLDYYGGFNGKTYDADGNPDPNGEVLKEPVSDKPESYSIRWKPDVDAGTLILHLADNRGWSQDVEVSAGKAYVDITNLVPNSNYTYKVSAVGDGKVFAEGNFSTTGLLHQVFFATACRNGRDLGGWKTLDGKTVKYRKIYRGGRMEEINKEGGQEAKDQGIGAELDLRSTGRLTKPAVLGIDFYSPGIEIGGRYMLQQGNHDGNFAKQCFEFIVNSLRENKGVYFHGSFGRDRTGTLCCLLLGLLGVREGDISKEYEVTYFAPLDYSVSSSELLFNPKGIFKNTRNNWMYSEVAPFLWDFAGGVGTFAHGVETFLIDKAGVSQKDIDDFRNMMLE